MGVGMKYIAFFAAGVLFSMAAYAASVQVTLTQANGREANSDMVSEEGGKDMDQAAELFPPQHLDGAEDNGINVLLDNAHQFLFFTAWNIPPILREGGFRVIGSQATLDTVLVPGQMSRVRLGHGKERPFGQWPNPKFNVVITHQHDPRAQDYLPEEVEAVRRFVEEGGGLIIIGGGIHKADEVERWPINSLAKEFGAAFTDQASSAPFADLGGMLTKPLEIPGSGRFTGLSLDEGWQVLIQGANDAPIMAAREFGEGRVAVIGDMKVIEWGKDSPKNTAKSKKANGAFLHELLYWAAFSQPPAGGSRNLPTEAWGGGPIYPELKAEIGNITVFYAKNQKEPSLKAISDYMPSVKEQIESWLPSVPPPGRMYLILSSGGGGGWAVNAYEPKEVGIISLDQEGILSVFAHELAHTMAGPPNDKGEVAGRLPGVFSEAHAGWFQGKIEALRTGKRDGHDPNRLFEKDPDGKTIDIADLDRDKQEISKGWAKLWWIWQKLDDRYGPTWYPRWLWVKSVRWQDDPGHHLSWDEVVEDMSIAVGEDLFAFFREIGTTLEKERFPTAEFMGEKMELPAARISITRAGPARCGPVEDYKKAIR